jgi:hypothetical protein
MMTMTPDQLKRALSKPTRATKPEKKGLFAKMMTPKDSPNKPKTRYQLRKQKEDEEKRGQNK